MLAKKREARTNDNTMCYRFPNLKKEEKSQSLFDIDESTPKRRSRSGFEPELSVPQTDVLTTIQSRQSIMGIKIFIDKTVL